jgi:hypothetical protein
MRVAALTCWVAICVAESWTLEVASVACRLHLVLQGLQHGAVQAALQTRRGGRGRVIRQPLGQVDSVCLCLALTNMMN